MREAVQSQAPGILYQNNSAGNIVTGGGPYGWVEPERYFDTSTYGSKHFGFHTEIGMPVVSTAASTRAMVGEDGPESPIGGAWCHHDWSERGNQAPHTYRAAIETRLGTARDLDDFTRKAQFVNYENFRAMFEAWNAHLWDNASGVMLWMSHPAWHSTVWQTYDYDFDVNGAYFGCRSACEPLHIQADPVQWQVIAVNHMRRALKNARVSAETYDLSGHRIASTRHARADVDPAASAEAYTSPFTDDMPELHLLRLTLRDDRGRVRSRNTYWRSRTPGALRTLNQLQQAGLSASLTQVSRHGEWHEATATVRNRGPWWPRWSGCPCSTRTAPGSCRRSTTTIICGCCPARPARSPCPGRPPPSPPAARSWRWRATTLPPSRCGAEQYRGDTEPATPLRRRGLSCVGQDPTCISCGRLSS
ncbi:glycoside hydrolase [Streptomyces davaonensis JCM 4913]|uniref:Glycoside hydrolase n=1 Tax=Streptomyces davaonensis (strain DSM 101723 / JCM 4913 / KCC S-0913 / 768) TaxID=1214101 RepID=K4QUH3_STRDJ|nr:glycoside hydrolase [Streptomyces davaonensis JCM 4913]